MAKMHTALTLRIAAAVLMYYVNSSLFWVNCWALVETDLHYESAICGGIYYFPTELYEVRFSGINIGIFFISRMVIYHEVVKYSTTTFYLYRFLFFDTTDLKNTLIQMYEFVWVCNIHPNVSLRYFHARHGTSPKRAHAHQIRYK